MQFKYNKNYVATKLHNPKILEEQSTDLLVKHLEEDIALLAKIKATVSELNLNPGMTPIAEVIQSNLNVKPYINNKTKKKRSYSAFGLTIHEDDAQDQEITKHGFIVLLVLCGGGSYQPVFSEDDLLMFFETEAAAQSEIYEAIQDIKDAIKEKHMSKDSKMTQDDYRIVPATLTGLTIRCEVDGDKYIMQRTEDDYQLETN